MSGLRSRSDFLFCSYAYIFRLFHSESKRLDVKRFPYRPSMRLRTPAEYERVYAAGQRRGDRHLLIFAEINGLETARCGISVSRRHGNAVKRMRLKRLLREAFRLAQHDLPQGFDFVLIPRQGSGAGLAEYGDSFVRLAGQLAKSIRGHQRSKIEGRGSKIES